MASISQVQAASRRVPGRKYDRLFFSGMVLLILVAVAVGFAPTYYAAGVFRAPLPSPIIHIHAIVFTAWIVLLSVQTGLVSAKRVALHRALGLAGFCLAVFVPIAGFLAMASQLHFRSSSGNAELTQSAVSFDAVFLFAVFAALAYASRKRDLAAHKRYILLATIRLIGAAIFRMPIPFLHRQVGHDFLAIDGLILILVIYDLWSTHKVNRATLWGGIFMGITDNLAVPLGGTAAWHSFASWVQSWNL